VLEDIATVCYCLRVNYLKKSGVDREARIRRIPGFDEEE
jgi:hypothetical protein